MNTYEDIIRKDRFDKCVEEMIKRYNLAVENLTEQQLAQAIGDAIACGDFVRFLAPQGQQVVYIPFAQYDLMRSRNEFLEGEFRKLGIDPYGTDPNEKDSE